MQQSILLLLQGTLVDPINLRGGRRYKRKELLALTLANIVAVVVVEIFLSLLDFCLQSENILESRELLNSLSRDDVGVQYIDGPHNRNISRLSSRIHCIGS